MIFGIGTDIIEIKRIHKILNKHKNSFISKIFTDNEIENGNNKKSAVTYFAGRWAAKEAFSKALGTGIGKNCSWKDIEIRNSESGNPYCLLSGDAEKTSESNGIVNIHLSISHEQEYATATVILEK